MRKLLIAINCVLAFLLALSLWSAATDSGKNSLEVGKKKSSRKSEAKSGSTAMPAVSMVQFPSGSAATDLILKKNVFDPQRSGGMISGRGATYKLVGIYNIGDTRGALILVQGGVRQGQERMKQYYKLGESLPNGYTLTTLTSSQAMFTRGASKMTLDIVKPSDMFPKAAARRSQPNQMQQMLDLMRQSIGLQQRQNRDMMQMMRDSGGSSRGGSSNRRRR